jgi:hypothetical protein
MKVSNFTTAYAPAKVLTTQPKFDLNAAMLKGGELQNLDAQKEMPAVLTATIGTARPLNPEIMVRGRPLESLTRPETPAIKEQLLENPTDFIS